MTYCIFETTMGQAAVVFGVYGVRRIFLPPVSRPEVLAFTGPEAQEAAPDDVPLTQQVAGYFAGGEEPLNFEIDWRDETPFRQRVYAEVRSIPYGEVRTYGAIARAVGRAGGARAVGMAMAANPVPPVVPCHRVVAAGGRIGGFSGPGGIGQKERLLRMEQGQTAK